MRGCHACHWNGCALPRGYRAVAKHSERRQGVPDQRSNARRWLLLKANFEHILIIIGLHTSVTMSKWALLGLAIFSEIVATSSLKSTDGFTKLIPSVVVLVGYCAAFYFLSLTLDTIPIGVAYAVWSGVGVAGIALISVLFFDQRLDAASVVGMGLIVAGVVVLRVFSDASIE